MGIFGGLEQDRYDRQYSDQYLFKRIGHYFKHQTRRFIVLSVMGIVVSISLALTPIIIAEGVDALENEAGTTQLGLLIGALLVTVVFQYVGNWLRRRMTTRIVADLMAQMRKDALAAARRARYGIL